MEKSWRKGWKGKEEKTGGRCEKREEAKMKARNKAKDEKMQLKERRQKGRGKKEG